MRGTLLIADGGKHRKNKLLQGRLPSTLIFMLSNILAVVAFLL